MESGMQQPYYYATGPSAPAYAYYPAPAPTPEGAYIMPQGQVMYYAPAPHMGYYPAPAPVAPMYYPQPEAAFAAMSLNSVAAAAVPAQTPGASSTTSTGSGSAPLKSSTPIPTEEPQPQQHHHHHQQQQHSQHPQQIVPVPLMHYAQQPVHPAYYSMHHAQQQQQHLAAYDQYHHHMNGQQRMMGSDPDVVDNLNDISQISQNSTPESFYDERRTSDGNSTPVTARRRISLPGQQQSYVTPLLPLNFKTRMCTQWQSGRTCSMGSSCKFAHGLEEIRFPDRPFRALNNPKYKTKMCKNFEPGATGKCAYGDRCEYIHPTDREFLVYKQKMEEAAARYAREEQARRGWRGGNYCAASYSNHTSYEEDRSARSMASAEDTENHPPPAHHNQQPPSRRLFNAHSGGGGGGYLGSNLPPTVTRSALRVGGEEMRRNPGGGSMFDLGCGDYPEEQNGRRLPARLPRVPSSSRLPTISSSHCPLAGGGASRRPSKFNRRASLCHLAADAAPKWRSTEHLERQQ